MGVKKKMSVSELKVHALQVIESVKNSRHEVEIYKRGVLVARISPATSEKIPWIGSMEGSLKIVGHPDSILEPIDEKWNALGDEDLT